MKNKITKGKCVESKQKIMESLHDLLTIVSIFLFVVISITSISSKCDYWLKMIALYLYFGFTACLIIPFGIISQNPIKSKFLVLIVSLIF